LDKFASEDNTCQKQTDWIREIASEEIAKILIQNQPIMKLAASQIAKLGNLIDTANENILIAIISHINVDNEELLMKISSKFDFENCHNFGIDEQKKIAKKLSNGSRSKLREEYLKDNVVLGLYGIKNTEGNFVININNLTDQQLLTTKLYEKETLDDTRIEEVRSDELICKLFICEQKIGIDKIINFPDEIFIRNIENKEYGPSLKIEIFGKINHDHLARLSNDTKTFELCKEFISTKVAQLLNEQDEHTTLQGEIKNLFMDQPKNVTNFFVESMLKSENFIAENWIWDFIYEVSTDTNMKTEILKFMLTAFSKNIPTDVSKFAKFMGNSIYVAAAGEYLNDQLRNALQNCILAMENTTDNVTISTINGLFKKISKTFLLKSNNIKLTVAMFNEQKLNLDHFWNADELLEIVNHKIDIASRLNDTEIQSIPTDKLNDDGFEMIANKLTTNQLIELNKDLNDSRHLAKLQPNQFGANLNCDRFNWGENGRGLLIAYFTHVTDTNFESVLSQFQQNQIMTLNSDTLLHLPDWVIEKSYSNNSLLMMLFEQGNDAIRKKMRINHLKLLCNEGSGADFSLVTATVFDSWDDNFSSQDEALTSVNVCGKIYECVLGSNSQDLGNFFPVTSNRMKFLVKYLEGESKLSALENPNAINLLLDESAKLYFSNENRVIAEKRMVELFINNSNTQDTQWSLKALSEAYPNSYKILQNSDDTAMAEAVLGDEKADLAFLRSDFVDFFTKPANAQALDKAAIEKIYGRDSILDKSNQLDNAAITVILNKQIISLIYLLDDTTLCEKINNLDRIDNLIKEIPQERINQIEILELSEVFFRKNRRISDQQFTKLIMQKANQIDSYSSDTVNSQIANLQDGASIDSLLNFCTTGGQLLTRLFNQGNDTILKKMKLGHLKLLCNEKSHANFSLVSEAVFSSWEDNLPLQSASQIAVDVCGKVHECIFETNAESLRNFFPAESKRMACLAKYLKDNCELSPLGNYLSLEQLYQIAKDNDKKNSLIAVGSARIEELKQTVLGQERWNDPSHQNDWQKSLFILRTINDLPAPTKKYLDEKFDSKKDSATAIKCLEEIKSGKVQMIIFGALAILSLVVALATLLIPSIAVPLVAICGAAGSAIPFIPIIPLGAATAFYAKRYFECRSLSNALEMGTDELQKIIAPDSKGLASG
jgi:hypothetical protein